MSQLPAAVRRPRWSGTVARCLSSELVDVVHQAPFLVAQAGAAQAVNRPMEWIGWRRSWLAYQQARFLLVRLQRSSVALARALQQEVRVEGMTVWVVISISTMNG